MPNRAIVNSITSICLFNLASLLSATNKLFYFGKRKFIISYGFSYQCHFSSFSSLTFRYVSMKYTVGRRNKCFIWFNIKSLGSYCPIILIINYENDILSKSYVSSATLKNILCSLTCFGIGSAVSLRYSIVPLDVVTLYVAIQFINN